MSRESRFKFLLDEGNAAYLELDDDGTLVYANQRFFNILGIDIHSFVPIPFSSLLESASTFDECMNDLFLQRTPRIVYRCRLKTNTRGIIDALLLPNSGDVTNTPDRLQSFLVFDNSIGAQIVDALLDDRLYPSLQESLPISILRKSLDGKFTYGNKRFCEGIDTSPTDLIDTTDFDHYEDSLARQYRNGDRRVIETACHFDVVERNSAIKRSSQHSALYNIVHVVKRPIFDHKGAVVEVECAFWHVWQRAYVLAAMLQEKERFYRDLLDRVPVNIYRKDLDLKCTYANAHYCDHLRLPWHRLRGLRDRDVFREELSQKYETDDLLVMTSGRDWDVKEVHHPLDGDEMVVRVIKRPLYEGDVIVGLQGVFWDITQQHETEHKLQQQIAELKTLYGIATKTRSDLKSKEALLKEVHHRVKNNLAIVSSLLGLAANAIVDSHARKVLQDCKVRVKTMAHVHEALYRSPDLALVNISNYLHTIVNDILATIVPPNLKVAASYDVCNLQLDARTTIPLGLIVSEALHNCVEHAFDGREDGQIHVTLRPKDSRSSQRFVLGIKDNGIGATSSRRSASTLGLNLIHELATRQLSGGVTCRSSDGMEILIEFYVGSEPQYEDPDDEEEM